MTAVRIEALDPTDERSQGAITTFLSEMVERVGADVLEIDVAHEAREDAGNNFFLVALDDKDYVSAVARVVPDDKDTEGRALAASDDEGGAEAGGDEDGET